MGAERGQYVIPAVTKHRVSGPASTALLHFDGANGGTTFTDVKGHTFSVASGTPTTSTAQFKFGTASLTGPTTSNIITPGNTDWQLASDFTIDFWVFLPDVVTSRDVLGVGGLYGIVIQNAVPNVFKGGNHSGGTISATTWTHIAAVRHGTRVDLYVNGVSVANFTDATTWGNTSTALTVLLFPGFGSGGQGLFIDELRIINGTAAWTSNFTPPTSPYTN